MENVVDTITVSILTILAYEVTKDDIKQFKKIVLNNDKSNEYYLETNHGVFKINKEKKTLIVLERNYVSKVFDDDIFVDNAPIDYEITRLCKVAKRAGFEYFLEKKYMN